jgi:prefoldin alpha subunit
MEADRQQELQRILMEADNYKRQIDSLSGQMQLIENTRMEINTAIETMKSLKENRVGTEILVPVGSGSFIKAELKDNQKVVIGIGAGLSVEKTIDEAREILESRDRETENTLKRIQNAMIGINNRLVELDSISRKLIQEIQTRQDVPVTEKKTQ